MTRSSSESVKASKKPAAIAGQISGSVTDRKVRNGGAPRSIAASSRPRSKVSKRDSTTTATKHRVTVVCAMVMVQKPRSSSIATNSSRKARPSAMLTVLKRESPVRMASAAFDLTCLLVLIEEDRHDQQAQQHHRDSGGERPVAVGEELGPQRLADHQRAGAAEQIRNDEF